VEVCVAAGYEYAKPGINAGIETWKLCRQGHTLSWADIGGGSLYSDSGVDCTVVAVLPTGKIFLNSGTCVCKVGRVGVGSGRGTCHLKCPCCFVYLLHAGFCQF
jgi:hypothetical protein